MKPLCFVLMPFGVKTDGNQKEIDFDKVYRNFIREAIIKVGLEPIRADEEKGGGLIHKPMYERLMFCDFAIADLSFANANVFYELGIRHALKPHTTVSIFETGTKLPFDTAPLRTFPYSYENGEVKDVQEKIESLAKLVEINFKEAVIKIQDSPIAQLITGYQFPDLNYLKQDADSFAEAALDTKKVKAALKEMRQNWEELEKKKADKNNGAGEKCELEKEQAAVAEKITGLVAEHDSELEYNYNLLYAVIDVYKAVALFEKLSVMLSRMMQGDLKDNIYIKQQLALAYNKCKKRKEAEALLQSIITQYAPDPETNGLLGAVYKGLMDDNKADNIIAASYHKKAVNAYLEGFESDPRNFYPGVNALTLMYLGNKPDDRFGKYMSLVKYAVERVLRTKSDDYWVQATALELAALDMKEEDAGMYYADAFTCNHENWMMATTAANLKKIYDKAVKENDAQGLLWLKEIALKLNPEIFNK